MYLEYNIPMEPTIGQKLNQFREEKGISLEEISQKSRIPMKYLRAIEANDLDSLPSLTQMRGYLRLYASVLDVEIESLKVEGYHLTGGEQRGDATKIPAEPDSSQQEKESEEVIEEETSLAQDKGTDTAIESQPVDNDKPPLKGHDGEGSSNDIFTQIGEDLRQRRNLLSLSLEDVRSQLHIQKHYLHAMETGKFDELISSIQAKGMLTNYANFLSLDVEKILFQFADGLQKQRLEKMGTANINTRSARELSDKRLKIKNFFSLDLLIIASIFIGFSAFVIWGVNRILMANAPASEETALPEVADILLATISPTPQITLSLEATEQIESNMDTPVIEETPLFTPASTSSPINIVIVPLQQAWVRVLSDSEMVYEGRLIPGNAYDFFGEEKVEILTGNAGALTLYLNNQELGSVGLIGQVSNLIFTKDGLILPTPTNTPTSTETPETSPTPTLTPSPSPTP